MKALSKLYYILTGKSESQQALRRKFFEALCEKGLDPNTKDMQGSPLLVIALQKQRFDEALVLIEKGAFVNELIEQEDDFVTPLDLCKNEQVKLALIQKGALTADQLRLLAQGVLDNNKKIISTYPLTWETKLLDQNTPKSYFQLYLQYVLINNLPYEDLPLKQLYSSFILSQTQDLLDDLILKDAIPKSKVEDLLTFYVQKNICTQEQKELTLDLAFF